MGMPGARRGVDRVRLPRRRHPSCLRCDARLSDPACARPPRTGRHAHGRRLRARERQGRRRDCHLGPRRDEHGHRHGHRHDGFLTHRLHHRAGRQQADWERRLPGNRYHRRHAAGHEAQLPDHPRAGSRARGPRSVPHRLEWPSRAGAHRHHEGRAADLVRVRLGCRDAPAARPAGAGARSGGPLGGARDDQQRQASDDSRGPRHHPLRRHRHRSFLRRAGTDPDLDDAPRNRRHSRVASAEPRHDGHARRGVGQHRHPGSRPAAGVRHAVRRPRHRQPQDVRAECEEDPHRHRPGGDRQERESGRGPCRRPARRCWKRCCPA